MLRGNAQTAKLLYQGHSSLRIVTCDGTAVYIYPYAGSGYDLPADIILVTHEHMDHNKVRLVTKKESCRVIRAADALKNGVYKTFTVCGITIEATEAYNRHHRKSECVGFILTLDGVSVYAAGDTSLTEQMNNLSARALDYALLPIDGIFNMGPAEASKCAELISAKHSIPIHMKPGKLFDSRAAEAFHSQGRIILKPGETLDL